MTYLKGDLGPICKQNASIRYVNIQSGHRKHIKEQILLSIQRRLSQLSESEEKCQEAIGPYQAALSSTGYTLANVLEGSKKEV